MEQVDVPHHTSGRLIRDDIAEAERRGDHVGRLITAGWNLGRGDADDHAGTPRRQARAGPAPLQPAAAMGPHARLRGHFSTKSRRYSVTLGELRRARTDWRDTRRRHRELFAGRDRHFVETTLLAGSLA